MLYMNDDNGSYVLGGSIKSVAIILNVLFYYSNVWKISKSWINSKVYTNCRRFLFFLITESTISKTNLMRPTHIHIVRFTFNKSKCVWWKLIALQTISFSISHETLDFPIQICVSTFFPTSTSLHCVCQPETGAKLKSCRMNGFSFNSNARLLVCKCCACSARGNPNNKPQTDVQLSVGIRWVHDISHGQW